MLIVGGSLNGLSTALFLADRGVRCLVVERHPQTTVQYKFRGISPRSMELYRGAGIEADIRAHRTGDQKSAPLARTANLAAEEVTWQDMPWADTSDIGPASAATCDQDHLEPILRVHAERRGAEVRFNTELLDVEQDADGVHARIRDRGTGREEVVHASYLVVADGTKGPVRERLGIERHGPGVLQSWMNVIFEADLSPVLQGRRYTSVFLTDINGTFVPREESERRWLMAVPYRSELGERPEDFDDAHCIALVRKGAGRPDLAVTIVDARPWDAAAFVADRYVEGRAFLVGDTAHVMPPTGGFGGNTGIHDAHNLAWKLDAVLRGVAGPRLLDTYESERRPVAERTLAQALARLQAWFKDPGKTLPPAEPIVDDAAVVFGYIYPAGAFIPDDMPRANEMFENSRAPSGRPGTRAAHVVVERDDERLSTIDLCNGHWVLLAGPEGGAWCEAAGQIDSAAAFGLRCYQLGPRGELQDVEDRWRAAFGVSDRGAILIRPDGFIAWRAREASEHPDRTLRDALDRLTFAGSANDESAVRSRDTLEDV